jgi:hypothetical protein
MRGLRLPVIATSLAVLAGCQGYRFKGVIGQTTTVDNQQYPIGVTKTPPNIMIVQDTSGSMCEPIQLAAPNNGPSCLATAGGANVEGYCSVCSPGGGTCTDAADCSSKMQLTASTMISILQGLTLTSGELNIGLTSFPDATGDACATGAIQVPIGDAVTTIPKIVAFYQGVTPNGGTPTSATLGVAAADPAMSDPTAQKLVFLVTDGLPNCAQTSSCTTAPWSDGKAWGCASPYDVSLAGSSAAPPTGCSCSFGTSCAAGVDSAFCCPVDFTSDEAWYCLDDESTESELASMYASQGITTDVVGMGYDYGSNVLVIDAMAAAGHGTAFQANSQAALQAALQKLIGGATKNGCDYTLDGTPVNPDLITVTLDGTPLVAGDPNGYTFTPPTSITLEGTTCAAVKSGAASGNLQITAIGS